MRRCLVFSSSLPWERFRILCGLGGTGVEHQPGPVDHAEAERHQPHIGIHHQEHIPSDDSNLIDEIAEPRDFQSDAFIQLTTSQDDVIFATSSLDLDIDMEPFYNDEDPIDIFERSFAYDFLNSPDGQMSEPHSLSGRLPTPQSPDGRLEAPHPAACRLPEPHSRVCRLPEPPEPTGSDHDHPANPLGVSRCVLTSLMPSRSTMRMLCLRSQVT